MEAETREDASWAQEFEEWLAPFLDALGHKMRRRWAPVYVHGLPAQVVLRL